MFSFQPNLALAPGVTSVTLWVLILHTAAVTAEPAGPLLQLLASPTLCGPSIFLGNQLFDTWGVHEVAHHITNPAEEATRRRDDHKQLLSEAAPQAAACPWQGQSATCM